MAWAPASKIGDTDADIPAAKRKLAGNSYGKPIGSDRSTTYTAEFGAALTQYGINVNADVDAGKRKGPRVTPGGVFDWTVKDQMDIGKYASPPAPAFRNIWLFSAPGSGAPWWVGPSFETGKWCQDVLHINHQPVGFPIGGYMGMMGGDPGLSYNEVIASEGVELERLLDTNPHVQQALNDVNAGKFTDLELWFSAYSQSADGMEDGLVRLFGDGRKYEKLRSRINGVLQFGNPSKRTTGIARKVRPEWLYALVRNITTTGDFYAEAPDVIRPLFYAEIVTAETSMSFAGHIIKIIVPVLLNLFGGFLGLGNLLGGLVGGIVGQVQADVADRDHEQVDHDLIELLSINGLLTNIPALFGLLAALPGLQAHGEYHLPKPEFGGRTGIQVACDMVASFRR